MRTRQTFWWNKGVIFFRLLCSLDVLQVFAVEHRYYGESIPTPDLSTSSLQWLSSRQALEDLSLFIVAMNKEYNLTSLNPWVSWGGRSSTLKP